jgi:hypothetical protein
MEPEFHESAPNGWKVYIFNKLLAQGLGGVPNQGKRLNISTGTVTKFSWGKEH